MGLGGIGQQEVVGFLGNAENAKHFLWMLKETHAAQFLFCHQLGVGSFARGEKGVRLESRFQQVTHHFRPFSHKEVLALSVLLQLQRAHKLQLILTQHNNRFLSANLLLFVDLSKEKNKKEWFSP